MKSGYQGEFFVLFTFEFTPFVFVYKIVGSVGFSVDSEVVALELIKLLLLLLNNTLGNGSLEGKLLGPDFVLFLTRCNRDSS